MLEAKNCGELIAAVLRALSISAVAAWVIPGILFIIGLCNKSDFYNGPFCFLLPCMPIWLYAYSVQMILVAFMIHGVVCCSGLAMACDGKGVSP